MPLPIRALSPHHPTDLDRDFLALTLQKAVDYGYSQIHICGPIHSGDLRHYPIGNLDGVIDYQAFPKLNAYRDLDDVKRRRDILAEHCEAAHAVGIEVFYWHHELYFPEIMREIYPEAFTSSGAPDLESTMLWDFVEAKHREAFEAIPHLSGTVLTTQETTVSVYHIFDDPRDQIRATHRLFEQIDRIHRHHDRRWFLRTFCWRESEYQAISAAVEKLPRDVMLLIKDVPMDWHLFYSPNEYLTRFPDNPKVVEMDPGAQYWGVGALPAVGIKYFGDNLAFATKHHAEGAVIRTDRNHQSMFNRPNELIAYAMGRMMTEGIMDYGKLWSDGCKQFYGEEVGDEMVGILQDAFDAVGKTFYVAGQYLSCTDSIKLTGRTSFFVAERQDLFEPEWKERLREKDEAVDISRQCLDRFNAIKDRLPGPEQAIVLEQLEGLYGYARAFRLYSNVVHLHKVLRYKQSEGTSRQLSTLFAEMRELARKLEQDFGEDFMRLRRDGESLAEQLLAFADQYEEIIANDLRPRAILDEAKFEGTELAGTACARAYPNALTARLEVKERPHADQVLKLVVFWGTKMCQVTSADVTIGERTVHVERGTVAWFWSYDGFKRTELDVMPEDCVDGTVSVSIRAEAEDDAAWISHVRLELESGTA